MPPVDFGRYLLKRDDPTLTPDELQEAQALMAALEAGKPLGLLAPPRAEPWKLLCHLAERGDFLLHGTGDPNIAQFVPRQPTDSNPFGAQNAVYAASDGLWPMYYAILDRSPPFSLHNACISLVDDGREGERYYFFSIQNSALARRPYRPGYVYILPKATFSRDPQDELGGVRFVVHHWASLEPVKPLAIVPVRPEHFPFLEQMRGHDDEVLEARMKEDPTMFPWVDELYADRPSKYPRSCPHRASP
ncbi:MAG TPA: hypothetical protein VKT78_10135 [Fimbriimonadaceae bacterium]|nr:hypothetical protein [Fimbriimonadaceae bacterium]